MYIEQLKAPIIKKKTTYEKVEPEVSHQKTLVTHL
tara:strand:- start:137 stop:241 length:105 start_codon:yes stop_codon:yes gene_type:complete